MGEHEQSVPGSSFTLQDAKKKVSARRATEAVNQMSDAFEITRYDAILLACEKTQLFPPNLPFLQRLHVRMAKKLFGDGLQLFSYLIQQSLRVNHGNLRTLSP